jgi:hypothetical protein
MHEEGWYQDPYGVHEARWFSDGAATKLVRDGDTESSDPAPTSPPPAPPVPLPTVVSGPSDLLRADAAEAGPGGPSDMRRADDAEAGREAEDPLVAILDADAQSTPPS